MYIIAIAWLYVALMMAITENSLIAGVLTFLFYGLAPLTLFMWLFGTRARRRRMRRRQALEEGSDAVGEAVDQVVHQQDGADAQRNQ